MNQISNTFMASSPAHEVSPGHSCRIACLKSIQAFHAWLDTLGLFVIHIRSRIKNHANYAETLRELNTLDERTLRELGINRNDFKAIAKVKYLTDATRLQRNQADQGIG
jgi:uncharacterized protein YjiS (DUF1127 family)